MVPFSKQTDNERQQQKRHRHTNTTIYTQNTTHNTHRMVRTNIPFIYSFLFGQAKRNDAFICIPRAFNPNNCRCVVCVLYLQKRHHPHQTIKYGNTLYYNIYVRSITQPYILYAIIPCSCRVVNTANNFYTTTAIIVFFCVCSLLYTQQRLKLVALVIRSALIKYNGEVQAVAIFFLSLLE